MRKINKKINITLIFMLIVIIMLWHCNISYSLPAQEGALRPQIGIANQRIIQELLLQLEEKDQITAGILKERLELMDPSDIDGLKYLASDLAWFLNNNRVNNIYYIPKESPKVSFIIVHYGESPHGTLSLLRSLKDQTYQNFDIVLIDNNSPDSFYKDFDSYDIPREIRGRITFIHNRSNLGYCGGNNQGSRIAIERKSDYVFLINNDGILENDGLAKMIDAVKNHPEIGVLQPYIYLYNEEESGDIEIMKKTGNLPQAARVKAESGIKNHMESISKSSRWVINAVQGIDGLYYREPLVSGTAQLVRSDMIRLSGGFDNRLFMYGDAWDIGYKYYITGLKKAMLTSVFVAHPAFDPHSELPYNFRSQYLIWRNHMFNAEQFYNRSAFGRMLIKRGFNFQFLRGTNPPIFPAGAPNKEPRSAIGAIDILQMRLKACSARENALMFIAIFKGVADGLLGNFKPTLESKFIDEKRITEDYAVQFKEMHSAFDIFKCIFSEQDAYKVRLMIFALYQNRDLINIEEGLPEELQGRLINILVQYINKWEGWIKSKERNSRDIASIREGFLMDVKKILASNETSDNWFAGVWWQHMALEYLYYSPYHIEDYYKRLEQEMPEDVKIFESNNKHKVILHATKNLPAGMIALVKDTLLEYTDREHHDSMVYKVLNTCNLTTVDGEPFTLVTLGYKRHDRLGGWEKLQWEELKVVREMLLLVDAQKNIVISGLMLGFEYDDSPQRIRSVRMSGLGQASCPVNSSLVVHKDYRNRFFGPTIIALGIKRACEIFGENKNGIIGEDIDSGRRSSPLERMFNNMGFSSKYPFGHGGTGVRLDELKTDAIFRVLPRNYEGQAIDMTKLVERTAL